MDRAGNRRERVETATRWSDAVLRHPTRRGVEPISPPMRYKDGERKVPCRTYEHVAWPDLHPRVVLERMPVVGAMSRYDRVQEPVGEEVQTTARSTSKSAVSPTFEARTTEAPIKLMSRSLEDIRVDDRGMRWHN
jgi:hypothetical protein